MDNSYTLIHSALLCEAQIFIEKLRLKKINSNPKIYANQNLLLLIGGVGKESTYSSLEYIFKNFRIIKALNVGVAGCSDKDITIGSLFCTNGDADDISSLPLITNDFPSFNTQVFKKALFDMEGEYFLEICKKYCEDIYIFKIVSDHLDCKCLNKEFVKTLIFKHYPKIIKYAYSCKLE